MKRLPPRKARAPDPDYLSRAALFYLSRFAASEHKLRQVLRNKIRRAALADPSFAADGERQEVLLAAIETIIAKHKRTGVLNDAAYAGMKADSLRRAGRSRRRIDETLRRKGIPPDLAAQALIESDDGRDPQQAELEAATALARRRRLGPWRVRSCVHAEEERRKCAARDIAALARAGFSLDIARRVLGKPSPEQEDDAER